MTIEYIKGDLFTTDYKYIAHGCNCQGVMGSGVARIIHNNFPECFIAYKDYCDHHYYSDSKGNNHSEELLGRVLEWTDGDIHILNCFTQDYYGAGIGPRFVSYDALAKCFESIVSNGIPEVAMPKIGAGLGGGDWNIVEAIINATLIKNGVKVKVYVL